MINQQWREYDLKQQNRDKLATAKFNHTKLETYKPYVKRLTASGKIRKFNKNSDGHNHVIINSSHESPISKTINAHNPNNLTISVAGSQQGNFAYQTTLPNWSDTKQHLALEAIHYLWLVQPEDARETQAFFQIVDDVNPRHWTIISQRVSRRLCTVLQHPLFRRTPHRCKQNRKSQHKHSRPVQLRNRTSNYTQHRATNQQPLISLNKLIQTPQIYGGGGGHLTGLVDTHINVCIAFHQLVFEKR